MKVCVVGSGGREHALATVLGRHHDVVVTPGNPGIPGSVGTPATAIEADLYVWDAAPHGNFPSAPERAEQVVEEELFLAKHLA